MKCTIRVLSFVFLCFALAPHAYAWDCSYWSQTTNPSAECYKTPNANTAGTVNNVSSVSTTGSSNSNSSSNQNQHQSEHQNQTQTQTANGGDASNAGNTQSVSTNVPRQAPSVAQGSVFVGDCGAGGNGGGSNTHGSAFLGFAWTPYDCKLLKAAAAYTALGMVDAACDMVNGISSVKARWKELHMVAPDCVVRQETFDRAHAPLPPPVPAVVVPNPPVITEVVTTPACPTVVAPKHAVPHKKVVKKPTACHFDNL